MVTDNISLLVSPNGDGKNDSFNLAGFGVDEIVIFNRYGLEVFMYYKTNGMASLDKGELPTATYFYAPCLAGGEKSNRMGIFTDGNRMNALNIKYNKLA